MSSFYQGGSFVEVLTASGKDPAKRYCASARGSVKRQFDSACKGYVWRIEGGAASRLALGECAKAPPLGLVHRRDSKQRHTRESAGLDFLSIKKNSCARVDIHDGPRECVCVFPRPTILVL